VLWLSVSRSGSKYVLCQNPVRERCLRWNQPGKPSSDFVLSIDALQNGHAFLYLNAHLAKIAISNRSIQIFNGRYWNNLHPTTTVSVRSGEIILLKVAGVVSCPGLDEQIGLLFPSRVNEASDGAEVNLSRQVSSSRLFFSSANIHLVVHWATML
jgi:hypothetical protein